MENDGQVDAAFAQDMQEHHAILAKGAHESRAPVGTHHLVDDAMRGGNFKLHNH
jgi:hypothetical protein